MNQLQELEELDRRTRMLQSEADLRNVENMNLRRDLMNNSSGSFGERESKTLIEYESDNKEVLDQIYHFLLSHRIVFDDRGERWVPPKNKYDQLFSERGATLLINQLLMYTNKTQISSNMSEEQIEEKMYYLGIELADYCYNHYEYLLNYQTAEQLAWRYSQYPEYKQYNEYDLFMYCAELSEEELREKLKYMELAIISILDLIHANLLRAKGGEERAGRRRTTMITQSIGGQMFDAGMNRPQLLKPSTWQGR